MNMRILEQQVQAELHKVQNANISDVKMLLKDIKTKTKVQNQRKVTHDLQKEKSDQRHNQAELNRKSCKEQEHDKIRQIKAKQFSRESRMLNHKAEKILSKVYDFNHAGIEEKNEYNRIKIDHDIASKLQVYSINHRNHIGQIKNKFYKYNADVMAKHDNYWEEQQEYKTDKKDAIDLKNAKRYNSYQKYLDDKADKDTIYYDQLDQKSRRALQNKKGLIEPIENQLQKEVNKLKGNSTSLSQHNSNNHFDSDSNSSNRNSKEFGSFQQKEKERKKALERYNEKKEKSINEQREKSEQILSHEYEKFKKANAIALDNEQKKQKAQLEIILTQEKIDEKINELNNKINKLKNESVYKKNPSMLKNEEIEI